MARNTNGTGFSLKDELFNAKKVAYLGGLFAAAVPGFDQKAFEKQVLKTMLSLELKARIVHIATTLEDFLDPDFKVAAAQIVAALPEPLDPTNTDNDFGDFIFAPLGEYVVRNGLAAENVGQSLQTLHAITQRFSMEDSIRYFLDTYPAETLAVLKQWVHDDNYHVRRLVSEGTRPLLPWSGRLQSVTTTDVLPFLHTLHADKTRYVTRSVANHLNDIAKSQPEVVIDALQQWQQAAKQDPAELAWMTKHALRTLLKQGHAGALQLLGFSMQPDITVGGLHRAPATLAPGEAVEFSFTITAHKTESLMIDYVIDFVKANGSTAPKVFKLKQLTLQAGDSITLTKRHPFRKNATTFTFYSGVHTLTLQINGQPFSNTTFILNT